MARAPSTPPTTSADPSVPPQAPQKTPARNPLSSIEREFNKQQEKIQKLTDTVAQLKGELREAKANKSSSNRIKKIKKAVPPTTESTQEVA